MAHFPKNKKPSQLANCEGFKVVPLGGLEPSTN